MASVNVKIDDQHLKDDELEITYLHRIIQVLHLIINDDQSHEIARCILNEGRQSLEKYRSKIATSVFEEQMATDDLSELLRILKEYVEYRWQKIPFDWFQKFLSEEKNNEYSTDEYERVLMRTAEYGAKFIKNCPVFSLVLQFIFDFEDEIIMNDDFFDDLCKSFAMNGLKLALERSSELIIPEVMELHANNPNSPLVFALREYFRTPLTSLFQQCKIVDRRNLFNIALDCLVDAGWQFGLKNIKVQRLIKPERYSILMQKLEQYLDEQSLTQHVYSSLHSVSSSTYQDNTEENKGSGTSFSQSLSYSFERTVSDLNDSYTNEQSECRQSVSFIPSYGSSLSSELECDTVKMCRKREEKFCLSAFMQAGELTYIRKRLNDIAREIVNEYSLTKNFSQFIHDTLTPIIYLLKRHQNLVDFFDYLSFHYSQNVDSSMIAIVKLNIRMILHILLLSSDLPVSQTLMTLLCKRNPVPFLEPSLDGNLYSFVSDIIHIWNYSVPTILSFGIGPCQGKSSLLNTLFATSFEQTMHSIYFEQTIDIDFGFNFSPRRSINIADTHGQITKQLLNNIKNLFDEILAELPLNKFCFIILRDVEENVRLQYPKSFKIANHSFSYEIPISILPNVSVRESNQNKIYIKLLREHLFEIIPSQCTYDRDDLEKKIEQLIDYDAKLHLNEMQHLIKSLINELLQTIHHNIDITEYFPVYTKFVQLCDQRQKIAKLSFYDATNEEIYILRQKIYELEVEISTIANEQTGRIFNHFIKILQSNETMPIINILTTDLQRQRNQSIRECQMADQESVEKNLSLEILWRNMIVCYPYQSDNIKQLIHRKYSEYMAAGYPFEIIDGDNYNFPYEFLHEALTEFSDKKILVISIIGPQNSGKSTLLNYMFGTLFDVRDGRCTRGIYGSFVKSNFSNFDYVLLIDTEGLMGIERGEREFDRRLVLFCLAVSHVMIINMIGEINDILKDMLTLCADTLQQIGVSKVPQPKIHFVLNQKADLNIDNNRIAIDKIRTDISKLGLDKMIDISKENFHTLPSAFKKERVGNDNQRSSLIRTEPDFLDHVQDLCGIIVGSGTQPFVHSQEYFSDAVQWLNFAVSIFNTLQKFSDLTYFRDVNERQQDLKVRNYIKNKLTEKFSSKYREQLIEETLDYTEDRIRDVLHNEEMKILDQMQDNLDNELRMLKTSETIRNRSRQFFKAQIIAMFTAISSSAIMTTQRRRMVRLVHDGQGELKRLIEETITNGISTTEIDAREKFDLMFNDIITSIQNKFDPSVYIRKAFHFIYTNYNIFEHDCLPDRQILIDDDFQCNEKLKLYDETNNFILEKCISSAYGQSSYIEEQLFDPDISNPYSFDIIENLVYLNKNILRQEFDTYYNNQIKLIETNPKRNESSRYQSLDQVRRVIDIVGNVFGLRKDSPDTNIQTYHFQKHIRVQIKEQNYSSDIVDENRILRISVGFQRLTDEIIKDLHDRQIDTDLIQRIIGSLHTIIKDIDFELHPFGLVLSRHIKGVLHSYVVLLLTKTYYDEKKTTFSTDIKQIN